MLTPFNTSFLCIAAIFLAMALGALRVDWGASEKQSVGKDLFPLSYPFTAIPTRSTQLIIASGNQGSVSVCLLEREGTWWKMPSPPMPAAIGRNGFAGPGKKKEGDGKTPSGIYPLEFAFGYSPKIDSKMPYRQALEHDVWVDDPLSPDYNQWMEKDRTTAASFEELRRRDHLYKYGLVIGYNRNPVVKGLGSAIFVHLWKKPGEATSGCVALSEKDMLRILDWLDPGKEPLIVLGTERTIAAIVTQEPR